MTRRNFFNIPVALTLLGIPALVQVSNKSELQIAGAWLKLTSHVGEIKTICYRRYVRVDGYRGQSESKFLEMMNQRVRFWKKQSDISNVQLITFHA